MGGITDFIRAKPSVGMPCATRNEGCKTASAQVLRIGQKHCPILRCRLYRLPIGVCHLSITSPLISFFHLEPFPPGNGRFFFTPGVLAFICRSAFRMIRMSCLVFPAWQSTCAGCQLLASSAPPSPIALGCSTSQGSPGAIFRAHRWHRPPASRNISARRFGVMVRRRVNETPG